MNTSPPKKSAQEIQQLAIQLLVEERRSREEVHRALTNEGLSGETATDLIDSINPDAGNSQEGSRDMVIGALWFVGGVVVTLLTYSMSTGGGTYVVAWGAVIFGAVQFIKGYITSRN